MSRRFSFCYTIRRVTPPGRYPVSHPREARTFLQYAITTYQRLSDHLTLPPYQKKNQKSMYIFDYYVIIFYPAQIP